MRRVKLFVMFDGPIQGGNAQPVVTAHRMSEIDIPDDEIEDLCGMTLRQVGMKLLEKDWHHNPYEWVEDDVRSVYVYEKDFPEEEKEEKKMDKATESIEKVIVLTFGRDRRYTTNEPVLKMGATIVTRPSGHRTWSCFTYLYGPVEPADLPIGMPYSEAKKYLVEEKGFSLVYDSTTAQGVTTAVFVYSLDIEKEE